MKTRSTTGIKTHFTSADKIFLTENFFQLTNRELADYLRMSVTVVRNQCAKMGLYRVKVYGWTKAQTDFLLKHYQFMGDVEMSEMMNKRFPRKTRPWTRKHIGKKRMLLNLLRTPEQLQIIKERNTRQKRYNLENARKVQSEKAQNLTDSYILSNCLRFDKKSHPKLVKEHGLLIELKRQEIIRKRADRNLYAVQ